MHRARRGALHRDPEQGAARRRAAIAGEVTAAGSAGGEGLRTARTHLHRSIEIFEQIGNDVELARSCRAYAEMLRQSTEVPLDPALAEEVASFAKRADDIFSRLKISSFGVAPEAFAGPR